MKQLRVTVSIRNNLLQQRRLELGMNQRELCDAVGIQRSFYAGLECMTVSPFGRGKERHWRAPVLALAAFHGLPPEDLFPQEILAMRGGKRELSCDVTEFAELAAGGPEALMRLRDRLGSVRPLLVEALTPREAKILIRRFGLDGELPDKLEDIRGKGKKRVSRERVRQLEVQALNKLRKVIEEREQA